MSAPNHYDVVKATADEFPDLLRTNTLDSIARFMQILGPRMRERDPRWGYLTKMPAEKHFTLPSGQLVGVDAFCYDREIMQVVDVLTNAADPGAAGPAWQEKERRPSSVWYPIQGATEPGNGGGEQDGDLEERVEALEQLVEAQKGIIVAQQQRLDDLEERMAREDNALRARIGKLEEKVDNLVVVGPSGTRGPGPLAHYHDINLSVVDRRTLPAKR